MRVLGWMVGLATLVSASSSAAATEVFTEVSGWTIVKATDICVAFMEYDGPGETQFTIGGDGKDTAMIIVDNTNWTSEKEKFYEIKFLFQGQNLWTSKKSEGSGDFYRKGFTTFFPAEVQQDFAKASGVSFFLGDTLIDSLSLKGSGAASVQLSRCIAKITAEKAAEAREKARWQHIPADPFAGVKGKSGQEVEIKDLKSEDVEPPSN